MTRWLFILVLTIPAVACGRAETPIDAPAPVPEGLTAKQRAGYEQCLEDNMAVAIAWEIIEQQCLEEVTAEPALLDPDLRSP